jgi:hypothetical protein
VPYGLELAPENEKRRVPRQRLFNRSRECQWRACIDAPRIDGAEVIGRLGPGGTAGVD